MSAIKLLIWYKRRVEHSTITSSHRRASSSFSCSWCRRKETMRLVRNITIIASYFRRTEAQLVFSLCSKVLVR